jgi:hypothetical protein
MDQNKNRDAGVNFKALNVYYGSSALASEGVPALLRI